MLDQKTFTGRSQTQHWHSFPYPPAAQTAPQQTEPVHFHRAKIFYRIWISYSYPLIDSESACNITKVPVPSDAMQGRRLADFRYPNPTLRRSRLDTSDLHLTTLHAKETGAAGVRNS